MIFFTQFNLFPKKSQNQPVSIGGSEIFVTTVVKTPSSILVKDRTSFTLLTINTILAINKLSIEYVFVLQLVKNWERHDWLFVWGIYVFNLCKKLYRLQWKSFCALYNFKLIVDWLFVRVICYFTSNGKHCCQMRNELLVYYWKLNLNRNQQAFFCMLSYE